MDAPPFPRGYSWNDSSPEGVIEGDFLERLEARLEGLYRELIQPSASDLTKARLDARQLCAEVTHSDQPSIGMERNRLLQPNWEQAWTQSRVVYTALFSRVNGLHPQRVVEYLYQAFCQLVRFVAEGTSAYFRNRIAGDLRGALGNYLSLRGYEVVEPSEVAADVAHSSDFRSVNWFGSTYTFTSIQAACVSVLWENWDRGTPEVSEHTILEDSRVESSQNRLSHLFEKGKHPAWGRLIVPGSTKGTFRLGDPTEKAKRFRKTHR